MVTRETIARILAPGDVLLYSGSGVFSQIIKIKTWSDISHCEGYVGDGKAVASRDGIGVGLYPLRTDGLHSVLRPIRPFQLEAAMAWFRTVDGQPYDWVGLLNFAWAKHRGVENGAQFCSEFLHRWARYGGSRPFNPRHNADCTSPSHFEVTAAYWAVCTLDTAGAVTLLQLPAFA